MSWIAENICSLISDFIGGTIDFMGEIINNIFYFIVEFAVSNEYVIGAQRLFVSLSLTLISLIVTKIVISGYLLETDYDPDADPFNLLVKIAETVAVITSSGWIFSYLLEVSKDFASDIIGAGAANGYAEQTRSLMTVTNLGNIALPYMLIIAITLITMVIFTVVAGLRGAELVAMNLMMPMFALDLLTNSRERWNNYFMAYLIAFFTYGIQILFFNIAIKSYATASYTNPLYFISAISFLILAIKAPKFIEKYIYKSGVSGVASGGVRMVAQTMVMRAAYR